LLIHLVFCFVCEPEIGIDRPSNDFLREPVQSTSSCCNLCGNDDRCQAWTNVARGHSMEGCWLKSVTPPKGVVPSNICGSYCTSGRKPIPIECTSNFELNTDRMGQDFLHTRFCDGPESCCAACEARSACKSWTYVTNWPNINGCYLKSALAPVNPSSICGSRCTSGFKKYKMTHSEAINFLNANEISVTSTGGCFIRSNPNCISFDKINSRTIDGLINLRRLSNCPITATAGTEEGHASSPHSHYNGFKVDIRLDNCINSYITNTFEDIGLRGDGAQQYKSHSGDIYAKENNHWDILYL